VTRRTVNDVMTRDVVTISKEATVQEAARLMVRHGISGLPVLDADHQLVGVLSTTDLLRRTRERTGRPWWHGWSRAGRDSRRIGPVMTAPAVTVRPDTPLVAAAERLEQHRITRLPVVDQGGKLLGIVTRCDLVRALTLPDDQIAHEILVDVFDRYLQTDPAMVHVLVQDGVVTLNGEVAERSMIDYAVRRTRLADGVIDVREHLSYAVDDTHLPHTVAPADH